MKREVPKYQTFEKESKTKTEINKDYFYNYLSKRKVNQIDLPTMTEEEFFSMND